MPLEQQGLANFGSEIDQRVLNRITSLFSLLDKEINKLSKSNGLSRVQVRLLQPLHQCVVVGDSTIFVTLSVHELGGVSTQRFVDRSAYPMNLATANFLAERDLGFKNAFGFQFPKSVLDLDADNQKEAVALIANQCIAEEIENEERRKNIVRLNPIFRGRDFQIDQQLAFVLIPFNEPFNTIYEDHIKPSVESIQGLTCLRADDIYDNRPIIEDIWRCTNQARILIAELTGRNPNVFYETGIAHTVGKEVILITQSMDDVPFDLKHLRCIVYEYTPKGIKTLEENLKNTVHNILARP